MPDRIYHLAIASDWDSALRTGAYRASTLNRTLEDEGFIHCSFMHQVQTIADLVYRGRDDVVLLTIDPGALEAEIRVEGAADGSDAYPHIYGPMPVAAVVDVAALECGPDGRLTLEQ